MVTELLKDFIKIAIVTINNKPLIALCENSICSEAEFRDGITRPLQVGHEEPHPSPEPVALTTAPAIMEKIESIKPDLDKLKSVILSYQ